MHFKNLYPKAPIHFKPYEYPGVKKTDSQVTCDFCGTKTPWYDTVSKKYVCSRRCLDYMREKAK